MPDTVTIYPGESYQMDPGGNCLYYTWFPPLGLSNADVSNPRVTPAVNTRYIVQGRTEAGCSVTDSIDILVMNDSYLNLPNAFTPGNRTNGRLQIVRRGVAELKHFAVYNRWGTKVFETSDINEGWDGTFNGEMQPMGVYIYTIEAITPSGQTFTKQGNVTLIR
jgi:gliding motility-associated-like protein